ncbi:MAG TPA: polyphosphate kinase 2 family protein, partial [Pseudolabrys sp.]|nr:polyphosphate kinase 2 family protein [Pseudolabrys sp.]
MTLYSIAKRFRIDKPDKFRLSACDPAACYGLTVDKSESKAMLAEGIERLSELQERLYACDRWSVLIVLQAMDAAGK